MQQTSPQLLVLYDGHCGFCDHTVQWLLEHDKKQLLTFAPLQGETAQEIVQANSFLQNVDSIVFVEQGTQTSIESVVSIYSTAVLRIAGYLGYPWKLLLVFLLLPRLFRDPFYKVFAKYRFRVFGRLDTCRIPDAKDMSRFLP